MIFIKLPGVYDIYNNFFNQTQDIFIISDTHFGDKEIQAAYPDRPTDEELVKMINSKAGKTSTLILLGDVGDLSYVRRLRAEKRWLIMGNHDAGKTNYQRKILTKIYDTDIFSKEQAIAAAKEEYPDYNIVNVHNEYQLFHPPFEYWAIVMDNGLFDYVFEGPCVLGEKLILSHEPIPSIFWAMNIHGHNHQPANNDSNHFNVCLDAAGYKIFNLRQLLKNGLTSKVITLHREIIDTATIKKRKI